jgi:hypothetical protein
MDRPTAIIYIGGHGAKVEKDGPVVTRSSVPPVLLDNVGHFSPVGNERVGVESDKLADSILTNTSIIPTLFMYLLCNPDVQLRDFLLQFITLSHKLDKEAGIHYESTPSERFQKNAPVDDKPLWFMSMGEHLRGRSDEDVDKLRPIPARKAAGDPIHFPLGVWCVLVDDAEGGVPGHYTPNNYSMDNINPRLFHPEMLAYTINHNCHSIARDSKLPEFKNKDRLISLLEEKKIPIKDFIDPFTRSDTPGRRTHFNDFNITNPKNIPILQTIIGENIDRATVRRRNAISSGSAPDPNDLWLIENSQFIKDAQMHAALTKHSTLYDIIMICKALFHPGTNIQIIDTTCSSDYARQPPLFGVLTGYNPDEDIQEIYESLSRTQTASSSLSSSSLSSSGSAASSVASQSPSRTTSWSDYFTDYVRGWFNLWFPPPPPPTLSERDDLFDRSHKQQLTALEARPRTPSPTARKSSGGSRKSHKKPKNRIKSKRKARSTKKKTQKIRRHRK